MPDVSTALAEALDTAVANTIKRAIDGLQFDLRASSRKLSSAVGGTMRPRESLSYDELLEIAYCLLVPPDSLLEGYGGAEAFRRELQEAIQDQLLQDCAAKVLELATQMAKA